MNVSSGGLKGPAIFLAQGWKKPGWTTLEECARTAASLGYKGLQGFLWGGGPIDVELAAQSTTYCEDIQATATGAGCSIVELADHCDSQLVSCSPTYARLHAWPAPEAIRRDRKAVKEWAQERAKNVVRATRNFGFDRVAMFSGTYLFPFLYPWPQRPQGLVEAGFNALAKDWLPILDLADQLGVDLCYELHPGEDLMCGDTFNRFLPYVKNHPRCKILLDLSHMVLAGMKMEHMLSYIDSNAARIGMMHVKDGELCPNGGGAVYSGYNSWPKRQSRFRSLGDGQISYAEVFALLKQLGLDLWATVEWEDCAGKGWAQGVREGAAYVQAWLDGTAEPAQTGPEPGATETFDDFASTGSPDVELIADLLGLDPADVNTTAPTVA